MNQNMILALNELQGKNIQTDLLDYVERRMESVAPAQNLSRLVADATNGTLIGADRLVEVFYPELKRLAASKMRREPSGHTWQPTVLVSELYLELTRFRGLRGVDPKDERARAAFFALASQVMHRLLIRHTRPLRWKASQVELAPDLTGQNDGLEGLAQMEALLAKLAAIDPQLRTVVELRVFEGLPAEEIATRMNCSVRTVTRYWRFAKSWLEAQMEGDAAVASGSGVE